MTIFQGAGDVAAVECFAGHDRRAIGTTTAAMLDRLVGEEVERNAVQLGVGNEVDNAGDGVRPVNRGRAFAQDFDALHNRARKDVKVGRDELVT